MDKSIQNFFYNKYIEQKEYNGSTKLGENTKDTLVKNWTQNMKLAEIFGLNNNLDSEKYSKNSKNQANLRLMSWNVRYYTDINNNPTIDKIAEVINKLKPDILCLQEATVGHNHYYPVGTKYHTDLRVYAPDYILLSSCLVVPSWYDAYYGNMIFIRKELADYVKNNEQRSKFFPTLCEQGRSQGKCLFNQYAKTYNVPEPEEQYGGVIKFFSPLSETRCYIKISFTEYDIICTHLEAYNGAWRRQQLDELNKMIIRPTIIMGDFNIVDVRVYRDLIEDNNISTSTREKIRKEWESVAEFNHVKLQIDEIYNDIDYIRNTLKWTDAYELLGKKRYPISNWSGTVVDYIFFAKFETDEYLEYLIDVFSFFTDHSDHIPIICDIYDKEIDEINTSNSQLSTIQGKYENYEKIFKKKEFIDEKKCEYFYNSQPLITYSWFDLVKKSVNVKNGRLFSDPFHTGNFSCGYGLNGIYFYCDPVSTGFYRTAFQKKYLDNEKINYKMPNSGLYHSGLTYEFTIRNDATIIHNNIEMSATTCSTPLVGNILSQKVDIVGNLYPGFMTNRKFNAKTGIHELFELANVYVCIALNFNAKKYFDVREELRNYSNFNPTDTIAMVKETIKETIKKMEISMTRMKNNDMSNEQITMYAFDLTIILYNSIKYINDDHRRRYKEDFIIISSANDVNPYINIRLGGTEVGSVNDITLLFNLSKYIQDQNKNKTKTGGYYQKYLKYKTKYLATEPH